MNRTVYILSVFLTIALSVTTCYSQLDTKDIGDLDSIAFNALEQNSDSTSIYAHLLLEESENQKAYLCADRCLMCHLVGFLNQQIYL